MGGFRSSVWDPCLIISQIVAVQSVFYLTLGSWIATMDYIGGWNNTLDKVFGYESLQVKQFHGRLVMIAFVLNALTGALGLWYVVKRTKLCLDFAVTVHFFHLIACWMYNSHFPTSMSWWLSNVISIIIMTVLGEFLCMRTEMKAIPLGGALRGPKADL